MTVIELPQLTLAFVPVALVAALLWRWSLDTATLGWATARMVVQLLMIGYVLTFIFEAEHPLVVVGVLAVMLGASSWIALRPLARRDARTWRRALVAIVTGGLFTLVIIIGGVLQPQTWFEPRTVVPIAGMIFSNAMNAVSLAAERYANERRSGTAHPMARGTALETALIPLTNSFFAVGLVALPGMMTGQILSGVEPHIAVRYQIVVMCMTFAAAGLAAGAYLAQMAEHDTLDDNDGTNH